MNKFFENLKLRLGHICAEKQPLENKKKGFTLQETLITLTILGVVAAITIPALINKYIEATNRTKVRKAMAAYEKALNQMIVDNDVKGDIGATINKAGCTIATEYFKKIQGSGCYFQTPDKVWWDITDIEHPLISIGEEITELNSASIKAKADSLDDDKTSFVMVGEFDGNVLRVNDLSDSQLSNDEKANLEKLYAFVKNEKINNEEPTFINLGGYDVKIKGINDDDEVMDCTGSTYEWCEYDGDQYNAAKRTCEGPEIEGKLPTVSELKAIVADSNFSCPDNNRTNDEDAWSYVDNSSAECYIWSSENNGTDSAYVVSSDGEVFSVDKGRFVYGQVLCTK